MENLFTFYRLKILVAASFILLSATYSNAECENNRMADSLVLVELYNSTGGRDWNNKDSWFIGTLQTWNGITLTEDGCNVKKIDLSDNNLRFELPSNINQLKKLTHFDVRINNLYGTLPDFSSLKNISHLNFNLNNFTGGLPDFSTLKNLNFFACAFNNIGKKISGISGLLNLEHFNIAGNKVRGKYPDISNLTNLKQFCIQHNKINGKESDLATIDNLKKISRSSDPYEFIISELGWSDQSPLAFSRVVLKDTIEIPPLVSNAPASRGSADSNTGSTQSDVVIEISDNFEISSMVLQSARSAPVIDPVSRSTASTSSSGRSGNEAISDADEPVHAINPPDFDNLPDIMDIDINRMIELIDVSDNTSQNSGSSTPAARTASSTSFVKADVYNVNSNKTEATFKENVTFRTQEEVEKFKNLLSPGYYKININGEECKVIKDR